MDDTLQSAVSVMQQRFGTQVEEAFGEVTLFIPPQHNLAAVQALRDEFQFNVLSDLTAVDYWPQDQPRFHLLCMLYSMSTSQYLHLRFPLDGSAPHLPTFEAIFPNANWYERELWDLFGICFDGHSDMRRILMPYDWEGHPLRKDYPLGYEEPQFTFNFDEISLRKPKGQK